MHKQLAKFRAKIEEYCKHTPYNGEQHIQGGKIRSVTQEDLASAIPMSREYLNRKLHGKNEINERDIIGIIKALIKLECVTHTHQVKELLDLMDMHDFILDWAAPPFDSLYIDENTPLEKTNASAKTDTSATPGEKSIRQQMAHLWFASLSGEFYYPLPEREQILSQLLEELKNPAGRPILVIDGLGGLGKTSLAVELIRRALERSLFDTVIGDSAKQEYLMGGSIIHMNTAVLDFYQLLDTILRQLNMWETLSLEKEQKRQIISDHLSQHHYLLFVDNIETAENAKALIAKLRSLLGKSRAIITSRSKAYFDFLQAYSLHGLSIPDTYFFLDKEQEKQKRRSIPSEQYIELYRVTGGAPLALKLITAQAQFLDLNTILRQLEHAGGNLYPFIFLASWNLLSPVARNLLIYIGKTVETDIGWDELNELSSLGIMESEPALINAIEQLITYSLLNTSFTTGHARYSIHQLTRQFVTSNLPQAWEQQGLL